MGGCGRTAGGGQWVCAAARRLCLLFRAEVRLPVRHCVCVVCDVPTTRPRVCSVLLYVFFLSVGDGRARMCVLLTRTRAHMDHGAPPRSAACRVGTPVGSVCRWREQDAGASPTSSTNTWVWPTGLIRGGYIMRTAAPVDFVADHHLSAHHRIAGQPRRHPPVSRSFPPSTLPLRWSAARLGAPPPPTFSCGFVYFLRPRWPPARGRPTPPPPPLPHLRR